MKTTVSATQATLLGGDKSIMIKTVKKPGKHFPYYPPVETIPGECEILFDYGNGKVETRLIRYTPGMKSVFVDEWSDKEKEKKGKRIKLDKGFLVVPSRDTNLVKYLQLTGYNAANNESRMPDTSALFEIIDNEAKAKEANEAEDKRIQALYFVNHAPEEDVRAIALAMAKNKAEADLIMTKGEHMLRYGLKDIAKKTPELFIDGTQSESLKNKVLIHKALQSRTIIFTNDGSALSWSEGDVIISAPQGMNVVDWFADMSLKKEEYKDAINDIKITLTDNIKEKTESTPWEVQVLEQALAKETIIRTASWYTVTDSNDEVIIKEKGKDDILEAIKTNKDNIMSYII